MISARRRRMNDFIGNQDSTAYEQTSPNSQRSLASNQLY